MEERQELQDILLAGLPEAERAHVPEMIRRADEEVLYRKSGQDVGLIQPPSQSPAG